MIKNMFKRVWLSTTKKKSKTLILILFLFVMANLLLATLIIKKSVSVRMQNAKEELGGIVYLQTDIESLRQKNKEEQESGENAVSATLITENLVQKIATSSYLKDWTYNISITANASSFKTVTTVQNENEKKIQDALDKAKDSVKDAQKDFNKAKEDYNNQMPPSGNFGGRGGNFNFNFNISITDPTLSQGDTTIQGIDNFNYIDNVQSGELKLVEGVLYQEENEVLISSNVAEANNIKVGDEIKLKTITAKKEIILKVVGIYSATDENFNYNTIYTNISTAKKFYSEEELKNLTVSSVRYYLNSASEKEKFLEEIESMNLNLKEGFLKLDIDDSNYQTMVEPIEKVGSFATTVMWIVLFASIVIISLIVIINVQERRYEMGVLLSLGATRKNIITQFILELCLTLVIGFSLSMVSANYIADKMGTNLLKENLTQEEVQTDFRGGNFRNQTKVNQIKELNIKSSFQEYLILFGLGGIIIIIACAIPSINVLRYQPKTILIGKE